jgi:hypothetical protein
MLANTWAEVYRDGDDDALGDPLEATAPVPGLERVTMSITERSQRIYDAESDELRVIRYGVGRAVVGTDIRPDDRIHDLRTSKWWAVRTVSTEAPGFTGSRALSFDLRAS